MDVICNGPCANISMEGTSYNVCFPVLPRKVILVVLQWVKSYRQQETAPAPVSLHLDKTRKPMRNTQMERPEVRTKG